MPSPNDARPVPDPARDPDEPPFFDRPGTAKTVLAGILTHGDVLGFDEAGRTALAVAVDDWLFDHLAELGVEEEDVDEDEELEPEAGF